MGDAIEQAVHEWQQKHMPGHWSGIPDLIALVRKQLAASEAGAAVLRSAIGEMVPVALRAAAETWRKLGYDRDVRVAEELLQRIDAALADGAGAALLARVAGYERLLRDAVSAFDDVDEISEQTPNRPAFVIARETRDRIRAALTGSDAGRSECAKCNGAEIIFIGGSNTLPCECAGRAGRADAGRAATRRRIRAGDPSSE